MLRYGKYIRVLGIALLAGGLALLVLGQITIYREHGLAELMQMVSPLNLKYYGVVALVLMPGATPIALGQWLVARRGRRRRRTYYLSDFMVRC